jgi:hypothetical protein
MMKRNVSKRLLSILICVCMVLSVLPAVTFAADMTPGEPLYLKPNENWLSNGAWFAAYFFGNGNTWARMEPVEGDQGIYRVTIPDGNWSHVIFSRMSPDGTTNSWENS